MESIISLEGHYEVSSPGRPYRANPEGVKNVPLSISNLPVSIDDMPTQTLPSWCCGTFPLIANRHWSRSRANMTAWRNFDKVLDTQALPHLDNHPLQDQPCSRTMKPCTRHTANTKELLRREAVRFWIGQAEVLIKMRSKTCGASSNDNQTMPTLSSAMWRIYALMFTGCEWHSSSINPPLNT